MATLILKSLINGAEENNTHVNKKLEESKKANMDEEQ